MKDQQDSTPLTTTAAMDFSILSPRPRQPEDFNDSFQVTLETDLLRRTHQEQLQRQTRLFLLTLVILATLLLVGVLYLDPHTITGEVSPVELAVVAVTMAGVSVAGGLWLLYRWRATSHPVTPWLRAL